MRQQSPHTPKFQALQVILLKIFHVRDKNSHVVSCVWARGRECITTQGTDLTTCFFNLSEFFINSYTLEEDTLGLTELVSQIVLFFFFLVSQCFKMLRKAHAFRAREVIDICYANNRGLSWTWESSHLSFWQIFSSICLPCPTVHLHFTHRPWNLIRKTLSR